MRGEENTWEEKNKWVKGVKRREGKGREGKEGLEEKDYDYDVWFLNGGVGF